RAEEHAGLRAGQGVTQVGGAARTDCLGERLARVLVEHRREHRRCQRAHASLAQEALRQRHSTRAAKASVIPPLRSAEFVSNARSLVAIAASLPAKAASLPASDAFVRASAICSALCPLITFP